MKRTDWPSPEAKFLASHRLEYKHPVRHGTMVRCTGCLREWPAEVISAMTYVVRVDAGDPAASEPIDVLRAHLLRTFAKRDPRLILAVFALPDETLLVEAAPAAAVEDVRTLIRIMLTNLEPPTGGN